MNTQTARAASLRLIGEHESLAWGAFDLCEEVTVIGRDPGCELVLSPPTVSRRHARIERRPEGYVLEDLGGPTGTLHNGLRLIRAVLLKSGDRIGIGPCTFIFAAPSASDDDGMEGRILGVSDVSGTAESRRAGERPEEKLRALLEIGRDLGSARDLRGVLSRTLDALFRIFPRAERGLVVLRKEADGQPAIKAAKVRDGDPRRVAPSRTIFEHVARQGQAVLSQDVVTDDRFGGSLSVDEAKIRTLMCAPLKDHRRRTVGILQIDTSDRRVPFTTDDLDLLASVAGQVSVALENARLLESAARERRRLALLAEAGEALAASLDLAETLAGVAGLTVPHLADLCLIDLLESDGSVRRVAAHADPSRGPLLDEALRRYPPDPADPHPAMEVLRTGRAVLANELPEGFLEAITRDPEHLGIVRRLGFTAYLVVPLRARGRTLGALSLIATEPGRKFRPDDVQLAEELARRAALAIDNAILYRAAEAARAQAEEATRAKDLFLAMLSHELRTPLTPALLGLSALIEDADTPDGHRATLEAAYRGVALEARLVDDLLDLTRVSAGKLRVRPERFDAHAAVREAVATCGEELAAGGLRLELDLAAPKSRVEADPARLQQVVWNLVKNAAKFTPPGGTIGVRTRVEPAMAGRDRSARLVVEVVDTGLGIEPELLPRLFEAFEQGGATRQRHSGGLGLGLAIGRAIARAHGGELSAHSEGPGRGATFRFALPLAEDDGSSEAVCPPAGAGVAAESLRILLVEDDDATRQILSRLLRRRGSEVRTAASVAEARRAAEAPFDLLISDIGLPDGTGLDLIRWLGGREAVSAIALTGYGMDEDVSRCREAGFAEHLTKPIDLGRLEQAIRRIAAPVVQRRGA